MNKLTPREIEILKLVVSGKTSAGIADNLDISIRTVESHRKNFSKKLGSSSLIEFTKYAIKMGWTDY